MVLPGHEREASLVGNGYRASMFDTFVLCLVKVDVSCAVHEGQSMVGVCGIPMYYSWYDPQTVVDELVEGKRAKNTVSHF